MIGLLRQRSAVIFGVVTGINVLLFVVLPHFLMPRISDMAAAQPGETFRAVQFVRFPEHEPDRPKADAPPPPETKPNPVPDKIDTVALDKPPPPASMDFEMPAVDLAPGLADGPAVAAPSTQSAPLPSGGPKIMYDQSEVDRAPVAVVKGRPQYPYRARRLNLDGEVQVKFLVAPDGRVSDIRILSAQPADIFDHSVHNALSGWRFKPGQVAGRPVSTWVTTTIVFRLQASG